MNEDIRKAIQRAIIHSLSPAPIEERWVKDNPGWIQVELTQIGVHVTLADVTHEGETYRYSLLVLPESGL